MICATGQSSGIYCTQRDLLHQSLTISCATSRKGSRGAMRDPVEHSENTGGYMTTLSLGQAARLTGRGKTILVRAISCRLFGGGKEDAGSNGDIAEVGRVYPFPAPRETMAELRARLTLAEERLTDLKAILEDMRRDRDAWREQAQTRLLPAPAATMSWWRWLRKTG
jgi:hypothetical protein